MAVDNAVCLELGYSGLGQVAENHHVCPVHPEYAKLPKQKVDGGAAKALMAEAGMADFEHDLISIDDDWRKNTTDAVASQLRKAGIKLRDSVAGLDLLERLGQVPVLVDQLEPPSLGRAGSGPGLSSGEAWNENRL